MRIRRRHPLPTKEIKSIREELSGFLTSAQVDALTRTPVDEGSAGDLEIVLSEGEPMLFRPGGSLFPTLRGFLRVGVLGRSITVDMGAVPYVTNGADIMAPGVVGVDDDLEAGGLGVVVEERHRKPLCIARMLMDSSAIRGAEKGKVAKNLHHVGDQLWRIEVV